MVSRIRLTTKEAEIGLRVCTLASGSKGNCIYVEGGGAKILVDAGLTLRETRIRLAEVGVRIEDIAAVVVTHEHNDHIRGLGPIGRALRIPAYMTPLTRKAAAGWLSKVNVREFEAGSAFEVAGLRLEPFSVPHDAADPVGFALHAGGRKACIATDLGYASRLVVERLRGANLLVLESNHDPAMLKDGPYPLYLKQRVAGKEGHLSNPDAARLLSELLHDGISHVVLAHLSQINNSPELAYREACDVLRGGSFEGVRVGVASQDRVSGFYEA